MENTMKRIETSQEKTDRENREHCKRIAEELEEYAEGLVYTCPECGSICTIEEDENDDMIRDYSEGGTGFHYDGEDEPENIIMPDPILPSSDMGDGFEAELFRNRQREFANETPEEREARIGRNPKTKEEIQIPASRVPVFKAGKALKDVIAK